MKKTVLLSVLCVGLGVSACKKETEEVVVEPTPPVVEEPTPVDPTPPVETPPVADAADMAVVENDAGEVVAVDETLFIKALYEVSCVQAQIDDTEKQKAIIDEVYARYGFDADSFKAAQGEVGEKENVKAALKIRMEKCTSASVAEGFAKAGDGGTEETKTEDKPAAPARVFKTGDNYVQRGLRMGAFQQGELTLIFSSPNKAKGNLKGKADGVFVNIPLSGTIQKDGSFRVNGNSGANNSVTITGKADTKSASGSLSGKINAQQVSSGISAKN